MIKRMFFLGTVFKLLFLTTISTAMTTPDHEKPGSVKAAAEPSVIHLTEATFKKMVYDFEKNKEWKYEGSKPAIIDFYADWCAPCRQLSPVIEELAKEYQGKIIVYKVDTEKERKLTQSVGVTALPTLLFIPMKGKPQVSMGALPKATLEKAINDVLLAK